MNINEEIFKSNRNVNMLKVYLENLLKTAQTLNIMAKNAFENLGKNNCISHYCGI